MRSQDHRAHWAAALAAAGALMVLDARGLSASLDEALQKLQTGDAAAAAHDLEQLAQKQPSDARSWRMLGLARHRMHDESRAIQAYQRALAIEPTSAQTLYALGVVYAAMHDSEHAFEWLERARST